MSALAGAAATAPGARAQPRWTVAAAIGLTLLGLLCFAPRLRELWLLWTGDALRSVGMLVPVASVALALRAWRAQDPPPRGSWWGLLPLAAALLLEQLARRWQVEGLVVGTGWRDIHVRAAPVGPLLCLYCSGAVLLFAGFRAWRVAAFPLLLLLLVNPVPCGVDQLVDLPLQSASARTARWFARLLSVPVQGEVLRLMFSPHLGIFIAPGCDGLRGAVAMGLLALIGGHLQGMRRLPWALYVTGAVLLAYLFNLLRLCAVIGYYWFALRYDRLGEYGAAADYAIGGLLFSAAAWFLLSMPRRGRRACTPGSAR